MKILHTADIHLREYEDERWKALKKLIEIGKKEKVEIFLISGDLFDKGINAENLRPKIRDVFSNTDFKIVTIPGNHDKDSYESRMYFGENITILNDLSIPFEYKDVVVWGMPFHPVEDEKLLDELNLLKNKLNPDKKNILLYHGELLDSFFSRKDFGNEGEERYMPVKLSYFDDLKIDYVLAGHFHSNFKVFRLKNGGYFIYPGSPISITKREKGKRYINIFETGKEPKKYSLDTPYFEELSIKIDPFDKVDPVSLIKRKFDSFPPEARVILTVKGFINKESIKIGESELVKEIKEIGKEKIIEDYYEFKDVGMILEDDLFKRFMEKLEEKSYPQKKKGKIQEMVIKAMVNVRAKS